MKARTRTLFVRIVLVMMPVIVATLTFVSVPFLAHPQKAHAANPNHTLVGAIRWDAWVGNTPTFGDTDPTHWIGHQVEKTLGPNQFHFRLPFFATETGSDAVQISETTQPVMDQDITYAHNAGIDYWAFDWYNDGTGLDIARKLYLSSALKSEIHFCIIAGANGPSFTDANIAEWVGYFKDPSYQTVLNGRPLVYIFGGTSSTSASDVTNLRNAAAAANLPNPYIVVMGSASDANTLGTDAVSSYNSAGNNGEPYANLAANDVAGWNNDRSTSAKVIPWVTTGWDNRPRYLNPVSWETVGPNDWVQTATPLEIAGHLQSAINWAQSNPTVDEANAVLMYAWNENDEGGWIQPTLYSGTDRLDAIQNVLNPAANLALHQSYSSSSHWDSNQTADKAFDGDYSSDWQAAQGSAYNGQWAEVDFTTNTTFDQVALAEYGNRTSGFQIQYWNGSSWLTAYTGTTIGSVDAPSEIAFPAVTGSKARIYYTGGSSTPILYELEIYNAADPGPDLALHQSYSSSSHWDANQTANKAFDGDFTTDWQAAAGSAYNGQWVEVDFTTNTTFDHVVLAEYGNRTAGFQIQYWNGSSWTTAYTGLNIGDPNAPAQLTFPAVTGSKARIYYTGGTNTPILYEFQIYNITIHH